MTEMKGVGYKIVISEHLFDDWCIVIALCFRLNTLSNELQQCKADLKLVEDCVAEAIPNLEKIDTGLSGPDKPSPEVVARSGNALIVCYCVDYEICMRNCEIKF